MIEVKQQEVQELDTLKMELSEVYNNKNINQNPQDYFQILTSKQSQVNKFDELIIRSKKTLFSFNKKPYATGFMRDMEEIKRASAPLGEILSKGTSVKAIFETELEHVGPFVRMLRYYISIGEQVRICDQLPLKMLLSDGEVVMLSLRNNDASKFKLTSMVVEHSDLTNAMADLFDKYWVLSMDLEAFLQKYDLKESDL